MAKLNLKNPPKSDSFSEIFHFIWNHGIGNELDREGEPVAWTTEAMESAFDSYGKSISLRTIQHWRSGKFLPSRRNMHILARVISGRNDKLKQEWAETLIQTLHFENQNKKNQAALEKTDANQNTNKKSNKFYFYGAGGLLLALIAWFTITFYGFKDNSIAVVSFQNLSSGPELDYISSGLTEDIYSSLVKNPNLNVLSRRSVKGIEDFPNFLEKISEIHGIGYIIEGNISKKGSFDEITIELISVRTGQPKWKETFLIQNTNIFDIQKEVIKSVCKNLGVEIPEEFNQLTLEYGTDNVEAYSHYMKGRHLLKFWHENRSGDSIWEANASFDLALKLDSNMGKAFFHKADAYYHLAAGDDILSKTAFETQVPSDSVIAKNLIVEMMIEARQNANTPTEISEAYLNQLFFSDDWSNLRGHSLDYSDFASKERGELEWFFGPVTLLLLNEEEALHNLIENRVLRYDPLNGTGHTYAIRQYLNSNQQQKAWERLEEAQVATFSNRINEVKGYLLFVDQDAEGLQEHVRTSTNLSQLHQDYFTALSLFLLGDTEDAMALLESSEALEREKIHKAIGLNHIGKTHLAERLINEIMQEPIAPALVSVVISYGAACGPNPLPAIPTLDTQMKNAKILRLPCIGYSER